MIDNSGLNSTSWVYDERGRVTSELKEIDGHQFATAFSYDALDRLRSMTYPLDNEGNLGEVVSYHYESLRHANLRTVDTSLLTSYARKMQYNVYGQLTSFEHRLSTPIKREYEYYDLNTANGLGRLQKMMTTAPNGEVRQQLEYSYDAVGNVKTIHDWTTNPENPNDVQLQTFDYDHLDRLIKAQATGGGDGTYQSEYKYNPLGNLIEKEGIGQGYFSATHPSAVTHLAYPLTIRAKGTPSSGVWPLMKVYVNQELIAERTIYTSQYYDYQFKALIKQGDEVTVVFANDSGERTLFVDWIEYQGTTYQSEASGVIYDRGDPFDNADVIAGQEAMYWGGGLRFTISERAPDFSYDANGNMTKYVTPSAGHFDLTYNAENQLETRRSDQVSRSFTYDGSGQRVKTVTTHSGSDFTIYYIGNYMEFLVSTSGWTGIVKSYYANGKLLATRDANDEVGYILDDHLSSSSVTLKQNGEVWGYKRYMPYGDGRASDGRQPHRQFTGQINDDDGFYYYNARYYIPDIGRFAQPDTIVPEPGNPQSLNRYSYVLNNPLKYTDPTGHYECEMWCEGDVISEKDIDFGAALPPQAYYNTDPASTEQLFDHIIFGGEILIAVACDLCDVGFTLYHWSKGDFHPVDIVGLMPLIPSSSMRVWRNLDEASALGRALGGCSFSFDTLVTTTEGQKPISEVQIGDLVLAYNEQLDSVGIYPVTAVWSHLDPVVVKLVIDGELILTTPEHPFFISSDTWVAAGELWLGAQVQKADGSYGAVEIIQVVEHPQEMYNLTVDQAHTYFVGDEQWLVHNACSSLIDGDDRLVKEAIRAGKSDQRGLDQLVAQLSQGNLNPGINTKRLFGNISYSRHRNGARVFWRQRADGSIEILAKSVKANEQRVINILYDLYSLI